MTLGQWISDLSVAAFATGCLVLFVKAWGWGMEDETRREEQR